MSQVAFSIRMERQLKDDFSRFCDEIGMSMSTAFVVFAKEALREQRIPFEVSTRHSVAKDNPFDALRAQAQAQFAGRPEPSLAEINAVIAEVRRDRRDRKARTAKVARP